MSVQEKRRIEILLAHCSSPAEAGKIVPELLGRARPRDCSLRGLRVLVKPNLLRAVPLACADPLVTAAACAWLLGQGASVTVADSPGFGTARGVAAAIGLEAALKPLGLAVRSPTKERRTADGTSVFSRWNKELPKAGRGCRSLTFYKLRRK